MLDGGVVTGFCEGVAFSHINIPEYIDGVKITSIGSSAFTSCRVKNLILPSSLNVVSSSAFIACDSLQNVYYLGTEEGWADINIGSSNSYLTKATRYYYVENESDVPTDGGNYWHYDKNGNPVIW